MQTRGVMEGEACMVTVVILFRNMGRMTRDCLGILMDSLRTLYLQGQVELLFVDDASEAGQEVAPLLLQMRQGLPFPMRVLRFKTRQHYTRGLAYALSASRGHVLFVSHDMLVPRAYIKMLLAVAAMDPSHGIVRGVSTYVDLYPQHIVEPPGGIGDIHQLNGFSDFVAERFGFTTVEDDVLTGDSMLIRRDVIEKIGVFDSKFFGYFGDVDYGLRAQRAGYRLVCAKGAWLFHEGAGYYNNEAARTSRPMEQVMTDRMKVVGAAYEVFRDKWGVTGLNMPAKYAGTAQIPFKELRGAGKGPGLLEPLVSVPAGVGEWV
jgi:hypothetical protein